MKDSGPVKLMMAGRPLLLDLHERVLPASGESPPLTSRQVTPWYPYTPSYAGSSR